MDSWKTENLHNFQENKMATWPTLLYHVIHMWHSTQCLPYMEQCSHVVAIFMLNKCHPSTWVISSDKLQHTQREISLCTSSIQTCMCTGYLPEDDEPDPRWLWRSHQNRKWYHHIIIHGKDDAEYDRRLHKFMKVTREHGLVLNKKKC